MFNNLELGLARMVNESCTENGAHSGYSVTLI